MKNKITRCFLFLIVFFVFFLFFFYCPAYLQAEGIPEIWTASIKTSGPTAIALDVYENLYIVEAGRNHLLVYSSDGKYLKRLSGLDKPISVAVDSNGRIFIGNAGRGNVEVFDADRNPLFKLGAGGGEFKQPTGIAVDGTGSIYVADGKEDKIKVYNPDGSSKFSFGASGNGVGRFNYPTSIAIDEQAGEIIVSDLQVQVIGSRSIGAARVQFFDMEGGYIRSFGDFGVGEGLLMKPLGVAVDTESRIYVTDAYQNVVQVFDNNCNFLKMLYDSDNPLRTPMDIAIGKETNRLFIASLNTASVEIYKEPGDNEAPTADAGPDQTLYEGDAVTLDGSYSIDPDGSIASYLWEQTDGPPVTLSDATEVLPAFTAPDVGPGGEALSFQLTVTDNGGLQSTDTCIVNVTWINEPPTANAGSDQTKDEGDPVMLDGSGSTDPGDGIDSYLWTQKGGTPVTLSDVTEIQPTFTAPDVAPGSEALSFQLTVTDNGGLQSTDTCIVNVTWENDSPTANAGPDQTVDPGDAVLLNGSNSTDPDDGIASYLWTQTDGTSVTLSDTTVFQPAFTAPDVGPGGEALSFQLTVTDNGGLPSTDTCIVNVTRENVPPTANAGPDQTKDEGDAVLLDGSNSTDPDGSIAAYLWEQTGGTPVTLSDAAEVQPAFTAPDVGPGGEALSFQLTVTDNGGLQSTDTCIVNITRSVTVENAPPTAYAGPDQTVDEGDAVTLNGSGSTDPDDGIASYFWDQTGGTPVTLSVATSVQPAFTAPDVGPGGEALSFQLTVTDNGGLQSTDTCIINVTRSVTLENVNPTAYAGPDQTVDEGDAVTLNGSGSTDPDDGIASYLWAQTAGTPVTLSDPTVSQPTFVAPPVVSGGTLIVTFQLTVTDNGGLKDTDEVLVTINDNGITGFPDDVITLESSPGENIGIKEDSSGNITSLNVVDPDTIEGATNRPQNFIYGLLEMQIKVPITGATATVKVYLSNPAPEGYKWYKYNSANGWIDFSRDVISGGLGDGAEFNDDRTEVTLYITDNGDYDDDPRGRIIKDPSGIGIAPVGNGGGGGGSSGDSGGGGGGGGGCFIALLSPVYQTGAGGKGTPSSTPNSTPNSIPKEEAKLSKEEQQKRAIEVFYNIFELSRAKERAANLEQMIALYYRIINQYPDVPLAQESYWRLIEMFFKDFNPPQKDKALSLYNEYKGRYPDSPLRNAVEGTITRSLYLNGYWNELLVFASPGGEEFKDPQKLKSPLTMFYYSEAKFRLNNLKEAFRGYEVIVNYFPDSRMAGTAKKRMAEINRKKNKSNRNHLLKVGQR